MQLHDRMILHQICIIECQEVIPLQIRAPTNINLLKSKMMEYGYEFYVKALMDLLGISRTTASRKLKAEIPFSQIEILKIKIKFHLSPEELDKIFFKGE